MFKAHKPKNNIWQNVILEQDRCSFLSQSFVSIVTIIIWDSSKILQILNINP